MITQVQKQRPDTGLAKHGKKETNMVAFLIGLVVGVVVGWHFPQPSWAKKAEDQAVAAAKDALSKAKDKL